MSAIFLMIALLIVAIMIIAVSLSRRRARHHSAELKRQFGPEYDRALLRQKRRSEAERELDERAQRVEALRLRELRAGERARFNSSWLQTQAQFVDDPSVAAANANELISEVMRALGYPDEGFDQRVADLSVEHPMVVQHYRAARALAASRPNGQINTEELRQAVVHYRVMFADLLKDPSAKESAAPLHDAHAEAATLPSRG